ncbi:MAG: hypothetical protein ACLQUW_15840 [Desulfobaccales bacterium]
MPDFSKEFVKFQPLFGALGKIVYLWANIEMSLDFYICAIFFHFDRKNIADKLEIPRTLNMKLKFLKKSFRNIPQLTPFKDLMLPLIQQIADLSKNRHDIIHGALAGIKPNSYKFAKFDHGKQLRDLNVRFVTFTIDDLHQLGNKMKGLVDALNAFDAIFLVMYSLH